ncbi:transposase [Streptomyces sp. NPDC060027]|uniref:transposase n=1 Tax=Streptomyces sp. NPDC060027 TaxID=3347040 RepID=UPI0036CEE9F3
MHTQIDWSWGNVAEAMRRAVGHYQESGAADPAFIVTQVGDEPWDKAEVRSLLQNTASLGVFWLFAASSPSTRTSMPPRRPPSPPGRPRRRPEALLGDKGYDSDPNREELRKRRILPVISRKGAPNIKGMGKLRYVVEQTFALLHHFKRLAVRWERRTELHDAFVSLACSLICWRRLKKAHS